MADASTNARDERSTTLEVEAAEEAAFPLMQLNNELLAGVAQRLTEQARRQLECVDQRAAAVTLAHGYVHHHELGIVLTEGSGTEVEAAQQPIVSVCGRDVSPAEAPAAVRWRLARHRITNLELLVSQEFDKDRLFLEGLREPLVAVLDMLRGSRRLKLTTVAIDARFGRGCDDVATSVARLVLRHADTIEDMRLNPCTDDNGVAAEHEHVELCQAVAACLGVQSFEMYVGRRGCLKTVERDCLPSFSMLTVLTFCYNTEGLLDYDALPRPSHLFALAMFHGWEDEARVLTDLALKRPDVLASLIHLDVRHYGHDLPNGFLDASPRLQTFIVVSGRFTVPPPLLGGCDPLTYARSLVAQFFAAKGERRLRFNLNVAFKDEQGADAVLFDRMCAQLLPAFHSTLPDVAVACSDAKAVVLGCGDILKAAVEANAAAAAVVGRAYVDGDPAMAALIGRAVIAAAQSNGADVPLNATVAMTDCAAAAPCFTALVAAAAGGRLQLDTALAEKAKRGGVVFQLTRGEDKRQLDIIVRKYVPGQTSPY